MNEGISRRIARDFDLVDLTDTLSYKLSGSDLHSVLLNVLKKRVEKVDLRELVFPNKATKACDLDGRLLNKLEALTYEAAAGFDSVELAPVVPIGTVAVLTGLDLSNVLSTVRAFECASDPTVGMALECARRRKHAGDRDHITRICTNQRVIRFPVPVNPAYSAHFKLFSMVSAGRDIGSFSFELAALREHIEIYLALLCDLQTKQFAFQQISVEISDTRAVSYLCQKFGIDTEQIKSLVRARDSGSSQKVLGQYATTWPKSFSDASVDLLKLSLPKYLCTQLQLLEERICEPLRKAYPETSIGFDMHRLTGLNYYQGPCFHVKLKNISDESYMIADGGFVGWTQRLLSDKKERLMTSAIGTEMLCRVFHQKQDTEPNH